MKYVVLLCAVFSVLALGIMPWSSPAYAHKPDRCFHTHFGGNTNCKKGIAKKRCTDAKGNKGKCVQSGSHCYCKLFPKRNNSGAARELLDLGLGIGEVLLDRDRDRDRRRRHRHRGRDRDREEFYEEDD